MKTSLILGHLGQKTFYQRKRSFNQNQRKPKRSRAQKVNKTLENERVEKEKKTITERNDDFEMAMAMSVTEEIERVRQAENDRESEELAKVLSISLHEVSRESVNNDDGMGVTNQMLTDR